jgi:hypothetical protein
MVRYITVNIIKDYFNMNNKKRVIYCEICRREYIHNNFMRHLMTIKHIKNEQLINNFYDVNNNIFVNT